jgi:hypothetical protein
VIANICGRSKAPKLTMATASDKSEKSLPRLDFAYHDGRYLGIVGTDNRSKKQSEYGHPPQLRGLQASAASLGLIPNKIASCQKAVNKATEPTAQLINSVQCFRTVHPLQRPREHTNVSISITIAAHVLSDTEHCILKKSHNWSSALCCLSSSTVHGSPIQPRYYPYHLTRNNLKMPDIDCIYKQLSLYPGRKLGLFYLPAYILRRCAMGSPYAPP